jgi:hopanoid biosynthesis associated radical SAM protein HpnH
MRFSSSLSGSLTGHFLKNALKGRKKFPLVLMLEPTHRCNLLCAGCDRIRLFATGHSHDLSVQDCLKSVKDSSAPVVTVTGGEPLLYEGLKELLRELIAMKKHIILCTNGLLAASFVGDFSPHPRLTLNFHLDGMEQAHDRLTGRPGTFKKSVDALKRAKNRGFKVCTNTSVYKWTENDELLRLFSLLKQIGVDGILVAPAFGYQSVSDDIFLSREEVGERFRQVENILGAFPMMSTPVYLDFLTGRARLDCTPWGNPTRNPLGWKSPCYLITDVYYPTFEDLMSKTPWEKYGPGRDERCRNCMVHSGFEATAMRECFTNPRTMLRMLAWNMKTARKD